LGMRNNEPLEGCWFSPGGRIYKNESWQKALLRIFKEELGLLDNGYYRVLEIKNKVFTEFLESIKEKSININVNTIRA